MAAPSLHGSLQERCVRPVSLTSVYLNTATRIRPQRSRRVSAKVYSSPRCAFSKQASSERKLPGTNVHISLRLRSTEKQAHRVWSLSALFRDECELICRERAQSLPEAVHAFKTHRLARCISGTPIQPFIQGADDLDHLVASCWYVAWGDAQPVNTGDFTSASDTSCFPAPKNSRPERAFS
jgi:hypothetical protein